MVRLQSMSNASWACHNTSHTLGTHYSRKAQLNIWRALVDSLPACPEGTWRAFVDSANALAENTRELAERLPNIQPLPLGQAGRQYLLLDK